jgi:hypothetical protein
LKAKPFRPERARSDTNKDETSDTLSISSDEDYSDGPDTLEVDEEENDESNHNVLFEPRMPGIASFEELVMSPCLGELRIKSGEKIFPAVVSFFYKSPWLV